jgi:uncharacterized protein
MIDVARLRYVPDFRVTIFGMPVPAALRASILSVTLQSGLEGADRVDLTLVNENLRWLDHPLLALDNPLALSIGYAPDPLEQMFVGEIVSHSASFPSGSVPTLAIAAQDRRQRLQQGTKVRWFARNVTCEGNSPIPDTAVAGMVSLENHLIPILDPISAALAVLIGRADEAMAQGDRQRLQQIIRKQIGESDYDFLHRICRENVWEMTIDHSGPFGGQQLRFMSPLSHMAPDVVLQYGRSLIDFTPRITNVGQIAGVSVKIWQPEIKMEFTVSVSWDWDRNSLNLKISPGFGTQAPSNDDDESEGNKMMLVEEPVNQHTAPRVILAKLLAKLNQRLTCSGSTIGDPRIKAGVVVRIEKVGAQFGGLYRITSANHSLDGGGYRTSFEARKEIWFGSIPAIEQGAVRLNALRPSIG